MDVPSILNLNPLHVVAFLIPKGSQVLLKKLKRLQDQVPINFTLILVNSNHDSKPTIFFNEINGSNT